MTIKAKVLHAYTPNERGHYGGGDHIVVFEGFKDGRLIRKAGDALCRPRHKFNCLGETDFDMPTCKRCLELAARIGITLLIGSQGRRTVEEVLQSEHRRDKELARHLSSPRINIQALEADPDGQKRI
jgi:hypothetical protein